MRKTWWAATLLSAVAIVLPVIAQQPAGQPNANSFFTGADPRKLTFQKVNPTGAMKTGNLTNALQPSAGQRSPGVVNTSSRLPRVTLGSWPPKLPSFSVVKTPPLPKSSQATGGTVNLFKMKN